MFVFMLWEDKLLSRFMTNVARFRGDASLRIMRFTDCVNGWGKIVIWQWSFRHSWSNEMPPESKSDFRHINYHSLWHPLKDCSLSDTTHSWIVHVINIKIANSLLGVLKMSKVSETFTCTIIAMLMMLKFLNCLYLITAVCTYPHENDNAMNEKSEKFSFCFRNNFEVFSLDYRRWK